MPSSSTQKRVALVIGSGGIKCAAALGLLKVFQREGIQISMAVGSSGGSIYAAAVALGDDADAAEQKTVNLWTSDLAEGYTSKLRAALSGESRFTERSGLADDAAMYARLQGAFGDRAFADTRIPLHVVASDVYTGETVVLTQGKIVDAVRASIAIPLVWPPWEIDGRLLVDGAVSDPLPVDVAIKAGADIIVAMGFELPTRTRMRSYTAVTAHFNSLYMNNILRSSFAFHNLAHHAEVIHLLPEFEKPIGAFDAHLIPYAIERGLIAAEAQLPYIRRLLSAES